MCEKTVTILTTHPSILFYIYILNSEFDCGEIHTICMISGFRREVDDNRAFLGYYTACSGYFLPTFRDNLSVLSSGVKDPKITQLLHQPLHIYNIYKILHIITLKTLRHVSVLRPSSGKISKKYGQIHSD